jgi:DNA-binding transcriptional regulator GbsR (MarR family)
MSDGHKLEEQIFSIFSELASTLGYSPIHGKIIGALLVEGKPLSLQDLARKTRYSLGMISLSLDLLEVLGVIKKIKKSGDRRLYVRLDGDLLEILKNAVIIKVKHGIDDSLRDLAENKRQVAKLRGEERRNLSNTIRVLEKEIKRLEHYVNLLSGIKLP